MVWKWTKRTTNKRVKKMSCGMYNQYKVESDCEGWPIFFSGDRNLLVSQVKEILTECGEMSLSEVYYFGKLKFKWDFGSTWDGIYALVERAVRTVADPVWRLYK